LVNLTTRLIEKTENLEEAKQKAVEFITKYAEKQNLTNWHYDQNELDKLTTSRAVAQYVKQVTNQIQQQKLSQKNLNLSSKQTKDKKP